MHLKAFIHSQGFAIKIKTPEGNLDWVFLHLPIFSIRDPAKFPDFIHVQKGNPQNRLEDLDIIWVTRPHW